MNACAGLSEGSQEVCGGLAGVPQFVCGGGGKSRVRAMHQTVEGEGMKRLSLLRRPYGVNSP